MNASQNKYGIVKDGAEVGFIVATNPENNIVKIIYPEEKWKYLSIKPIISFLFLSEYQLSNIRQIIKPITQITKKNINYFLSKYLVIPKK